MRTTTVTPEMKGINEFPLMDKMKGKLNLIFQKQPVKEVKIIRENIYVPKEKTGWDLNTYYPPFKF